MMQFTTANGKSYTLRMKDGDHMYRWYGDGKMPKMLQGGYTDIVMAQQAAQAYLRTVDQVKVEKKESITPAVILDTLNKKQDLLEFANKHNIEVPENFKIPSQIKKYLATQVGE